MTMMLRCSCLCLLFVLVACWAQNEQKPSISTSNGNLHLRSRGDVVFEVGENGVLQLMTSNGDQVPLTQKGADSAVISWNECTWNNLNNGLDYGLIVECRYFKQRNDTSLRITWNGNMRITRCAVCCMRWYFTIDGEECVDPGPIDAVIFQSRNYHILRQSTITGSCHATGSLGNPANLTMGAKRIQFSIKDCTGFGGTVYDAYTGWNSVSRIVIEELLPRDNTFPLVSVHPPKEYVYEPNYCQYFFSDLGVNEERNLGTIAVVKFEKLHDHTVLRITWEGNFRKKGCINCCSRWWINIDGSPCSNYESIETTITSASAIDTFIPTTLSGVCFESANLIISSGVHQIRLEVGNCPGSPYSNAASGFHSASRLIVDEIPNPRDPLVNSQVYHPQWVHCVISEIDNGDLSEGTFNSTLCILNKTSTSSAVRVSFNGNLRLTNCINCCMRWFITFNDEECTEPAPIEAVIYSSNARLPTVHRSSTVAGICTGTSSGPTADGLLQVKLNIGQCSGFNETYDASTGIQSQSTLNIEELPKSPRMVKEKDGFTPNWFQCVTETALNSTVNDSSIMTCTFTKLLDTTVLRVAWDGNIAVTGCENCCMRWFITIDDEECADPGPIDAAIRQDLTLLAPVYWFDDYRPVSIVGYCRGNDYNTTLSVGDHTIGLSVGACDPVDDSEFTTSEVRTGYNSVSRFIIEELPDQNPKCSQQIVIP